MTRTLYTYLVQSLRARDDVERLKIPIASTWLISSHQISSHDPLSEEYLCFMSCVAQQDIPRCLLPLATKRKELEATRTLKLPTKAAQELSHLLCHSSQSLAPGAFV